MSLLPKDTVIIHDTIHAIVEKNIDAELYKTLIQSQQSSYNLMMFIFLGIITIFAGATWYYNYKIKKNEIIKEIKKLFKIEKEKFTESYKKEFNNELDFIKGERSRLFAITLNRINENNDFKLNIQEYFRWLEALIHYHKCGKLPGVRLCSDEIKKLISIIEPEISSKQCKMNKQDIINSKDDLESLDKISDILSKEKDLIKNFSDKIFQIITNE